MFLFGVGSLAYGGDAFKVNSIESSNSFQIPQLSAADEKNDIDPGYPFP
jgi:hypothetical protein